MTATTAEQIEKNAADAAARKAAREAAQGTLTASTLSTFTPEPPGQQLAVPQTASAGLAEVAKLHAALAVIDTPVDASQVADMAAAVRDVAKRAKAGAEIVNAAMAVRLRAEVELARLVEEGQAAGEIAGQGDPRATGVSTLADLGIDGRRLAEARKVRQAAEAYPGDLIAALSAKATDADRELTRAAVLRIVQPPKAPKVPKPSKVVELDQAEDEPSGDLSLEGLLGDEPGAPESHTEQSPPKEPADAQKVPDPAPAAVQPVPDAEGTWRAFEWAHWANQAVEQAVAALRSMSPPVESAAWSHWWHALARQATAAASEEPPDDEDQDD